MPSDVGKTAEYPNEPGEPPSVRLIVRLFVIPLAIVAAAVGVMVLIGLMAGGQPSLQEAIERLKNPGGQRTARYLIGPAAKQRYLDAKTLVDRMKSGMSQSQRITLASQLIDILDHHTRADEGQVQHFVLLALGRVWQMDPSQPPADSEQAAQSRQNVVAALLRYADAPQLPTRKAAVLALAYLAGYEQASAAIPRLIAKLEDPKEDLDVRIAAATVLGPLGNQSDQQAVIQGLRHAMEDADPRHAELVWSCAVSLAQLNQPEAAEIILKLLDRRELARLQYYDRETDPENPVFRTLSDQEQQRILINTMLAARKLNMEPVQQRLRELAQADPSPRVRAAGLEILQDRKK